MAASASQGLSAVPGLQGEEVLERMFASTAVLIAYLDRDLRFIRVNDAYARADGRDPSFFPGKEHFALYPGPENEAIFREVLATGRPYVAYEKPFEYPDHPERGATYWHVDIEPVMADGTVIGLVLTMVDRTERTLARQALALSERRLAERAAELERSNADLAQFAYVVSHDLRAPLRSIAGFADLLVRRYQGRLDADADEFLGFIADGVARMQQLIDDLLVYSRVGTRAGPPVPVDAGRAVADALANLEAAVSAAGAVITVDPLPVVTFDPAQLVQLFQNLIGNAVKFVVPGVRPAVRVTADREPDAWRFLVEDNGIGVPESARQRIFGMFQRAHEPYPGTGIGLAVCDKIVARHGGRIWVEPRPEGGSRFCFTVPAEGSS